MQEQPMPNWLNHSEYPFAYCSLNTPSGRIHYVDEGTGPVILFVHGTPSWSFDFRHAIKALSVNYRCVAIDHLGFGLSDKPKNGDYALAAHTQRLALLINHLKLDKIHLVVHDFGGPIALPIAQKNEGLFCSITFLNTWMFSTEGDRAFEKLRPILRSPLLPVLYRYFNFSPRFLLPASFGAKKLDPKIGRHYTAPFPTARQREAPLAFVRALLLDQPYFNQLWNNRMAIDHLPKLFIWGMADKAVTPRNLDKFLEAFPNSTVVKLINCGHFPQEEEPKMVNDALRSFYASLM